MSRWARQHTVTRLDSDGWVELYDPVPQRLDWADQADGAIEFQQRESPQAYWYEKYGWTDVVSDTNELKRRVIEKQPYKDPKFPWEG